MAEQSVDISRALGHHRNVVAGFLTTAQILMEQGHYQDADARYGQILEAARHVGDQRMEGAILPHQGNLASA